MKLPALVFLALSALPVSANAETLTIEGLYPAGSRQAAQLQSIAIIGVGGEDGEVFADSLEAELQDVRIDDRPYFKILGGRSNGNDAQAVFGGVLSSSVNDTYYEEKRDKCIKKDEQKKCIERKHWTVNCKTRVIRINASMRLLYTANNQIIYAAQKPNSISYDSC